MRVVSKIKQMFPLRQIIKERGDFIDTYDMLFVVESDSDVSQLEAMVIDELRKYGRVMVQIKFMNVTPEGEY